MGLNVKVYIVGAGISGLYSAFLLSNAGVDVEIFEASCRSGGRINSFMDDRGGFVELGAEIAYAPESPLMKYLNKLEIPVFEYDELSYYYYENTLISEDNIERLPDLKRLLNEIDELEEYNGQEMSLLDYFKRFPFYTDKMENLLNAFACEYGTTAEAIGVLSLANEESRWSGGDEEYYMKTPFQNVSNYFCSKVSGKIHYNKCIKTICHTGSNVCLIDEDLKQHNADKVIVTVNLGILKAGDIVFEPPLSSSKKEAILNIGIEKGIKVILQFSQAWWPKDLMTIEGGHICYEYLASKNYDIPTLTGFIMGRKVDDVCDLNQQALTDILLNELNDLFLCSKPVDTFKYSFVKHWGDDQFHKGAYSFSTPDSQKMRERLSEPEGDNLFFCGEACNVDGHAASVHGAMESAERVCKLILGE